MASQWNRRHTVMDVRLFGDALRVSDSEYSFHRALIEDKEDKNMNIKPHEIVMISGGVGMLSLSLFILCSIVYEVSGGIL